MKIEQADESSLARRIAEAMCAEAGMNPNNWPHKMKQARAAIAIFKDWLTSVLDVEAK